MSWSTATNVVILIVIGWVCYYQWPEHTIGIAVLLVLGLVLLFLNDVRVRRARRSKAEKAAGEVQSKLDDEWKTHRAAMEPVLDYMDALHRRTLAALEAERDGAAKSAYRENVQSFIDNFGPDDSGRMSCVEIKARRRNEAYPFLISFSRIQLLPMFATDRETWDEGVFYAAMAHSGIEDVYEADAILDLDQVRMFLDTAMAEVLRGRDMPTVADGLGLPSVTVSEFLRSAPKRKVNTGSDVRTPLYR